MGGKTYAMNVQAETNQDEDKGLVYNHDEATWQLSSPYSMSVWSAQLNSKDNSTLSLTASRQASINLCTSQGLRS